jgi:thiamine monophosphate synthase
MFETIVITCPFFFDEEAEAINDYLHRGFKVHIRKPEADIRQVEDLLCRIPIEYRSRVVLHDFFSLAEQYAVGGVHLNSRNAEPPKGWGGTVSRSCHSLDEVREWKQKMDYVSLSPIFDSISKQGYRSAFTRKMISEAVSDGTIDEKVYALGGITFDRLDEVRQMGFGGAMILGDAWK